MERKEKRNDKRKFLGRQRTGSVFGGILTVLFVCVFSEGILTGCGARHGEEFALEQETAGEAAETPAEAPPEEGEERFLYVHVCGAVNSPGLKKLPEGSRVFDALEEAGGFAQEADNSAVNLAAFVADGQQIYFPEVGEEARESAQTGDGKVNLNTADEKELCSLTGIGSSRAQAILEYRERQGGFGSIEELMQVPGIKEATYEKICDHITVK